MTSEAAGLLATICAPLVGVMGNALARLGELPLPDVGNMTSTAILGWYAWHTASKTIPGLIRDFRAETAAQREEHRAESCALRSELAAERERRRLDTQAIVDALHELSHRLA